MTSVFISVADEDLGLAYKLDEMLRSNRIAKTFIADRDVEAGSYFVTAIQEGIEECDWVISILTKNSFRKPWILQEPVPKIREGRMIPLREKSLRRDEIEGMFEGIKDIPFDEKEPEEGFKEAILSIIKEDKGYEQQYLMMQPSGQNPPRSPPCFDVLSIPFKIIQNLCAWTVEIGRDL